MAMKKIILGFLLVFAFVSCESDKANIQGTAEAVNGENVYLKNIEVKLYGENENLVTTTKTNDKGDFFFSDLEDGNYYIGATLKVNDEIFDSGNVPQLFYVSDEITKKISIALTKK